MLVVATLHHMATRDVVTKPTPRSIPQLLTAVTKVGVLVLVVGGGALGVGRLGLTTWRTASTSSWPRPWDALTGAMLLALAALLGWLALGLMLGLIAEVSGAAVAVRAARLHTRLSPALTRSVVAVALGTTLASASGAGAATAAPQPTSAVSQSTVVVGARVTGGGDLPDPSWRSGGGAAPPSASARARPAEAPDRTTRAALPPPPSSRSTDRSPATGSPGRTEVSRQVTVRSGDSLWRIAERELGPEASTVVIDRTWRQLWADNRAAIGDNPDLIHPGLVLSHTPEGGRR